MAKRDEAAHLRAEREEKAAAAAGEDPAGGTEDDEDSDEEDSDVKSLISGLNCTMTR